MPEADDLTLLCDAAHEAGQIALRHFRADPQRWDKPGGAGPVTQADLDVNHFLHDRLRPARPDLGWLSEETEDDAERLTADRVFIVDPIDGTRAFIAHDPSWAVVIAIAQAGVVTSAVVHQPARGVTYAARLNGGATRNGSPIRSAARDEADGAQVLAARPVLDPSLWPGGMPRLRRAFRPALAYRLALVGEGRFDAMITLRPSWEWDIAAGALIVSEAGGTVTDRHGSPLRFNRATPQLDGVVAAGGCHGALLSRLTRA